MLTQDLAPATVAKRLSFSRTFLHVARRHKLIDENPFSEVKIPTANVSARQRFVDRDAVQKLFDVANPTWRIIIALARYGGLRCPPEVLSLEWRHIDWERNRITVPSPKTDRYDGKESRTIPLFPELRTYLEEAFELAEPGQTYVGGGEHLAKAQGPNGWRNCNLRTTFNKLVKRAGLEPAFTSGSPFDKEFERVIAGGWRKQGNHGKRHVFTVTIRKPDHPITRGMPDHFVHANDELYQNSVMFPDSTVLAMAYSDKALDARNSGADEPILWVASYGKGRVCENVLGHDVPAMKSPGFQTLLIRGVEWAATGDASSPVPQELRKGRP
jgi:hypothetical protein